MTLLNFLFNIACQSVIALALPAAVEFAEHRRKNEVQNMKYKMRSRKRIRLKLSDVDRFLWNASYPRLRYFTSL